MVPADDPIGATSSNKFGTFRGVFLPSILTILGVILYLRLGWILGQVGYFTTAIIVLGASAITFLTALSISATATNMKIGGGGAYFMISRSFGIESGAAIGIPLFLAQALGVSFYLAGFSESINYLIPWLPTPYIGLFSLALLSVIALISANLALRTQMIIFLIIIASLVSFFLGDRPEGGYEIAEKVGKNANFWMVFAVFFPAVTGIEAGISMSGDLKNPARSLPWGTLFAVVIGAAIYLIVPFFLALKASPAELRSNPMIMKDIAIVGELVLVGLWGATLSSALGALLGAPRTLQALAKARIVPTFFSKGHGEDNLPRTATFCTIVIAATGIMLGDLNAIAPVLSMFFLTTYGFLNLAAGFEGLFNNPSWRPTFRTPWILSFVGAFACLGVMLMISPGATFLASFACIGIYWITQRRKLEPHWLDMRRSLLLYLARYSIYRLDKLKENTRSWRPNILLLSGSPMGRWHLVEFASAISHGQGFLTVCSLLDKDVERDRLDNLETTVKEYLEKHNVDALVQIEFTKDIGKGMSGVVRTYGLGPLIPNVILVGNAKKEEEIDRLIEFIFAVHRHKRNIVILTEPRTTPEEEEKQKKRWWQPFKADVRNIDVWWGRQKKNAGLMLTLAYMYQTSANIRGATLHLKSIINPGEDVAGAKRKLDHMIYDGRINAETRIVVKKEEHQEPLDVINEQSANSELVFIGLRPPTKDDTLEGYRMYYKTLLEKTAKLKQVALILSSEDVAFDKIFTSEE